MNNLLLDFGVQQSLIFVHCKPLLLCLKRNVNVVKEVNVGIQKRVGCVDYMPVFRCGICETAYTLVGPVNRAEKDIVLTALAGNNTGELDWRESLKEWLGHNT